ncbi:hypothetical protein B0H13DRAFT_2670826 [Mycena leptocephala]|nr:hypothetical protein B0H13DRAFT_2670826 [Mycena leptocephala]
MRALRNAVRSSHACEGSRLRGGGELLPECVGDVRRSLEGKWAALACHETRSVVVQVRNPSSIFLIFILTLTHVILERLRDPRGERQGGIVDKLLGQGAAVFGEGARAWGTLGHATSPTSPRTTSPPPPPPGRRPSSTTPPPPTSPISPPGLTPTADDRRAWSAPLHFIDAEDNPPTSCSVDYTRDCGASGCSISAIANYTQRMWQGGRERHLVLVDESELDGHAFLPAPRPMSKAEPRAPRLGMGLLRRRATVHARRDESARVLRGRCSTDRVRTVPTFPFPSLPLPLLFPSMASVRAHAVRMCLPACSHSRITRRVPRAGTRDESANSTASADSASARCNPDVRMRRLRTFCMIRGVGLDFRIRATPT